MLTSKATLLVGGWLAATATLVALSGLLGEAPSHLLLVLAAAVALLLTRGPGGTR